MPQPPTLAPAAWAGSPGESSSQPLTLVDSGVGASSRRGRKRRRPTIDENDVPQKLSAGGLACPFYKNDAYKNVDCLGYTSFEALKHVKLHIERCHRCHAYYCPSCGEKFDGEVERDVHVRARTCEQRAFSQSGMTGDQQHKINKITGPRKSGKTEREKWYEIWDVLFPSQTRPESPTRGSVEHEMAVNLQAYMQTPRYHALRDCHYPEYQEDVQAQDRILCFVTGILTDHAKFAEEERGNGAAEFPPAEPQQLYCLPAQLMLSDWLNDDRNE
ncbi:hypothetical protein PG990_014413 [Apiospora arundinis]